MNAKDIKEVFEKNWNVAKETLEDTEKLQALLQDLEKKIKDVPHVGDVLADLPILVSMITSYLKKEYTEIPTSSLIAIVVAFIYLVNPFDLVPDSIPVIGLLDDAAVVGFVVKSIHDDLEVYKKWKESK